LVKAHHIGDHATVLGVGEDVDLGRARSGLETPRLGRAAFATTVVDLAGLVVDDVFHALAGAGFVLVGPWRVLGKGGDLVLAGGIDEGEVSLGRGCGWTGEARRRAGLGACRSGWSGVGGSL